MTEAKATRGLNINKPQTLVSGPAEIQPKTGIFGQDLTPTREDFKKGRWWKYSRVEKQLHDVGEV